MRFHDNFISLSFHFPESLIFRIHKSLILSYVLVYVSKRQCLQSQNVHELYGHWIRSPLPTLPLSSFLSFVCLLQQFMRCAWMHNIDNKVIHLLILFCAANFSIFQNCDRKSNVVAAYMIPMFSTIKLWMPTTHPFLSLRCRIAYVETMGIFNQRFLWKSLSVEVFITMKRLKFLRYTVIKIA